MIIYRLTCKQGHAFDAWFASSGAFDEQLKDNLVSCPSCGTDSVLKALMTPNIATGGSGKQIPPDTGSDQDTRSDQNDIRAMMHKVREYVEKNADYVGDRFADEARKIHYEESDPRSIYGEATIEDVKKLDEEEIVCHPLPVLPEEQN